MLGEVSGQTETETETEAHPLPNWVRFGCSFHWRDSLLSTEKRLPGTVSTRLTHVYPDGLALHRCAPTKEVLHWAARANPAKVEDFGDKDLLQHIDLARFLFGEVIPLRREAC